MKDNAGAIPAHSTAGLAARDIFFSAFNDVSFYVEDLDQENLYFEIFRKLFPSLKITQIFPLGGKQNVLAHCGDAVNLPNAGRSIYVVDKDFDDLLGHIHVLDNLFYLRKYCIENFLLEEDALIQIALESSPKSDRSDICLSLKIESFLTDLINSLLPLSRMFFAVQRFNLGTKNSDLAPERFSVNGKQWHLDNEKAGTYASDVSKDIIHAGIFSSVGEFESFLDKTFVSAYGKDANISGVYLLKCAFHYLKSKYAMGSISVDSFRYRLACKCELASLHWLREGIGLYLSKSGFTI